MLAEDTVNDLEFELDLPPSVNALYQKRRGGGQALTDSAKIYKEHVKDVVMRQLHLLDSFPVDLEQAYGFAVTIKLINIENPGWFLRFTKGKKKGERKAKTRFKVVDVDNRIKFLQDCITKTVGIPDDSQVFDGHQRKIKAKKDGVFVRLYTVNVEDYLQEEDT